MIICIKSWSTFEIILGKLEENKCICSTMFLNPYGRKHRHFCLGLCNNHIGKSWSYFMSPAENHYSKTWLLNMTFLLFWPGKSLTMWTDCSWVKIIAILFIFQQVNILEMLTWKDFLKINGMYQIPADFVHDFLDVFRVVNSGYMTGTSQYFLCVLSTHSYCKMWDELMIFSGFSTNIT